MQKYILPAFKPHPHETHPGQDLQWVANPQQGLWWISRKIDPESTALSPISHAQPTCPGLSFFLTFQTL
jgi:hypothetical protein